MTECVQCDDEKKNERCCKLNGNCVNSSNFVMDFSSERKKELYVEKHILNKMNELCKNAQIKEYLSKLNVFYKMASQSAV